VDEDGVDRGGGVGESEVIGGCCPFVRAVSALNIGDYAELFCISLMGHT
jgi:hypothetical protein